MFEMFGMPKSDIKACIFDIRRYKPKRFHLPLLGQHSRHGPCHGENVRRLASLGGKKIRAAINNVHKRIVADLV